MIERIQAYQCECDKCGHQWRSYSVPRMCTQQKCRTTLWNEEHNLKPLVEAISTPVNTKVNISANTGVKTRIRCLDKKFDEVEMIQTEVWLMSDKTKHLFKRDETNQLIDLGINE